MFVLMGSGD
ncbi:hypothetical protein HID58_053099 [Brassica napus]|uniref:Uncharacterized protein n=1 Tax=Brassica napus TaxID=3708 RepID=A0ABQ8ADR7_BRANA|nr:hypothetical protein HID58_053099 [Brassica napus]